MENHSGQTYHTTMQQTDASSLPCYDCLNTSEDGDGDEDEDEDNQEEKKNEEDEQA
ncbi:hypothetical protein YC2023_001192 [Brassica napus]